MIKGIGKVGAGLLTGVLLTAPLVAGSYKTQKEGIDTSRVAIENSLESLTEKINNIKGIHSQDKETLINKIKEIHRDLESSKGSNKELEAEKTRLEGELNKANLEIDKANKEQTTINSELDETKNKVTEAINNIDVPKAIELP